MKEMDDITKILQGAGEVLAKIFTGKELKNDLFAEFENIEPEDIYTISMALVAEGKFNEAEDFLFANIEKNYTNELFVLGESLIQSVIDLGDERLKANDYSLEDAESWQADWAKLYTPLEDFTSDGKVAPNFPKKKGKRIAARKTKHYNEHPQV